MLGDSDTHNIYSEINTSHICIYAWEYISYVIVWLEVLEIKPNYVIIISEEFKRISRGNKKYGCKPINQKSVERFLIYK